jgi:hypothetical protein
VNETVLKLFCSPETNSLLWLQHDTATGCSDGAQVTKGAVRIENNKRSVYTHPPTSTQQLRATHHGDSKQAGDTNEVQD